MLWHSSSKDMDILKKKNTQAKHMFINMYMCIILLAHI